MRSSHRPTPASSSLAIGVATAFIALAAALSFVGEPSDHVAGWQLRGTIAPGGTPTPLPASGKRA